MDVETGIESRMLVPHSLAVRHLVTVPTAIDMLQCSHWHCVCIRMAAAASTTAAERVFERMVVERGWIGQPPARSPHQFSTIKHTQFTIRR